MGLYLEKNLMAQRHRVWSLLSGKGSCLPFLVSFTAFLSVPSCSPWAAETSCEDRRKMRCRPPDLLVLCPLRGTQTACPHLSSIWAPVVRAEPRALRSGKQAAGLVPGANDIQAFCLQRQHSLCGPGRLDCQLTSCLGA